MLQTSEIQNNLAKNAMNIFNSLSFYSPLIICVSVVIFSVFTVSLQKAFVFFGWIFVITFARIIIFKGMKDTSNYEIPEICLTGLTQMFIPKDVTYSIYILTFAMTYFITPMVLVSAQNKINVMNYGVLFFFVAYITLDVYIKTNLNCIVSRSSILSNIVGALIPGILIVLLMYGSRMKTYLYMNEINSNKEVCSMPSKQQFKCNVYRNGELVGNL